MPVLQIHIVEGSWVSTVANTNLSYPFVGANLGDQETAVQQLSAAMQEGPEALTNGIGEIFEIGDTEPTEVVQQVFNTTDVLMYEDAVIYGTVGEEMLLDDIEAAGETLALMLVGAVLGAAGRPARGSAATGAPQDSTAAIDMTFTNYSTTQFYRGAWGWELEDGFGSLNTTPGTTLKANDGMQSMSASQILSGLDTGPYYIYVTWYDPNGGSRFGVKLYVPFQMFHIGKAPYWYVSQDTDGGADNEPKWVLSGDSPAYPYTWPNSVGFNIVATPTADHTSLSVQIIIQDLNK